jgi:glyoxylase-like metal-dependent hydrolase (beta-lactamase superfamily II)
LVPSRYALRVGEIDVLVISDGVFHLPAATLVSNADPAELAAWLKDRFQSPEVYTWALNALVVRSGGRTVLIDSGVGSEFPDAPHAGRLATRLNAAGIDPASVTDVVITHLHVDHVGGLLADGLRGRLRPDVLIHLAAAEVEFWTSPDFSRNTFGGFPDVLQSAEERFIDAYRSQLRPFETQCEVAPGVIVRRTGGHTRGHSVVHVASGGDRLTFLGDAVFPNHFDRPDWHNAFDHDPRRRSASGSVSCGRWLRPASCWRPLTCRSRASGGWRSTATSFVGYRPSGLTDRLLGQGRTKRRTRRGSKRRPRQ